MMRERLLRGAVPPLVYLALALLLLAPGSLLPWAYELQGAFYLGELSNSFILERGLLEQHRIVASTDMLGYPQAGVLVFIAWGNLIITLLGSLLGSALAGYNLSVPIMLALAGWFGFLLAERVGGRRDAAWIGGLFFAFNPVVLGMVYNAQVGYTNHAWIALFVLLLLSYLERGGWWRLLGIAATLAWVLGNSPYYGIFCWMFMPLAPAWWMWRRPERWRTTLLRSALVLGAGALAQYEPYTYLSLLGGVPEENLLLPAPVCPAEELIANVGSPQPAMGSGSQTGSASAGLIAMFLPLGAGPEGKLVHQDYLGISAVLVVFIGLLARVRRGLRASLEEPMASPIPWLVGAVVFSVLALGPYLVLIERHLETSPGSWFGMPFLVLWRWLPFFDRLCTPYRFLVLTSLCMVPLLALGLGPMLERLTPGRRRLAVLGLGALLLLDFTALNQVPWPLPWRRVRISPIYERIAEDLDPVSLIELPYQEPIGDQFWYHHQIQDAPPFWNERLAFHQTVHRKRLGVRMTVLQLPAIYEQSDLVRGLADQLAGRADLPGSDAQPGCDRVPVDPWLQQHGFRYLVLHERLIPDGREDCLMQRIEASLSLVERDEEAGISLWLFEAPEQVRSATPGPAAAAPPSGAH
jgi:hypothetical protein